jgi:uncharacterized membrane protein YhaH (DUF805 family)
MHLLAAFLLPTGRLSQSRFFGTIVLMVTLRSLVTVLSRGVEDPSIAEALRYLPSIFAWMEFCLFSRRLHDCGKPGLSALLYLIYAGSVAVLQYDYTLLSRDPDDLLGNGTLSLDFLVQARLIYFLAMALLLICTQGDDEANGYGQVYGHNSGKKRSSRWKHERAALAATVAKSTKSSALSNGRLQTALRR